MKHTKHYLLILLVMPAAMLIPYLLDLHFLKLSIFAWPPFLIGGFVGYYLQPAKARYWYHAPIGSLLTTAVWILVLCVIATRFLT